MLYRGAKIIILDEPTAVLVPQEVDALFDNLRELKAEGHTLIFISHKLDEVLKVADDITVIRRGTTVSTVKPKEVSARQLAELMVGSELPSPSTEESTVTDRPELRIEDLEVLDFAGRPVLSDINLTIHAGEVLGIAGVEGNGQTELVEAIVGMLADVQGRRSGSATRTSATGRRGAAARPASASSPRTGNATGCCWTHRSGRTASSVTRPGRRACKNGWISRRGARSDAERIIEEYDVRTPGRRTPPRGRSRAATSRSSSSAAR